MKFPILTNKPLSGDLAEHRRAYTLVELMVATGVFVLMLTGIAYAQMFGLKLDQLTQSKLGASDQTRKSFDKLIFDMRSAKRWYVGNATITGSDTFTNFVAITNSSTQGALQGNTIQIWQSTTDPGSNTLTYYFFDTNHSTAGKLTGQLRRSKATNGVAPNSTLIVDYLQGTNMLFRRLDYQGNLQTTSTYKSVCSIILEFYQYQYPITVVGSGYFYDYYRTTFKLTMHAPDGS